MESKSSNAPIIVIVGETASGKTELADILARRFNGEIIAADSWTVYRGFDIGTAKPHAADGIKYHLLDVADPRQGFSAPLFQRMAMNALTEITNNGKTPIIVGGTGLYIDSLLYSYEFLPPPSKELRAKLDSLSINDLRLLAESEGLNTDSIDLRNKRRIIRLIENNGDIPKKHPMRPNSLLIGVRLRREELQNRIAKRVDYMLETGLVQEVDRLQSLYGWSVEPMKGIGYREFRDYFNGSSDLQEVRDVIVKSTMNLAKRQRTWFKRNKSIHWVDDEDKVAKSVDLITTFLNK